MRFHLLGFLAIVLFVPLHGGVAPTGTLRGVVRDGTGAVLPDATILIQRWKVDNSKGQRLVPIYEPLLYTASEGQFSVELPSGLYDVFISYPALSPFAKKVRIEAGKETRLDCELPFNPLVKLVE